MPKHSFFFILFFLSSLILFSLFPGCCLFNVPVTVTGTVYGYVAIPDNTKDLTGYTPIPGATVTIVDADGVTHTVLTDENGYYCFNNISIKTNTIINITKDTEGGGKLIFKDIVPLVVSQEEDYDAGIADAESTAIALVVEGLVNLDQVQEEIDLDEITSSDGFDELKEDIQQAQEDNQDFITDNPVNTQAEEIADNVVNPPEPEPEPEPGPSPSPTPTASYTITFNKNDDAATGTTSAQTIASGSSANLTACAFTKTGWTFTGWATTSGGAVAYDNQASYTMGTSNVTLYAQWTSTDATISAGTLAAVSLAGTFTGGANIASSSALTVTVPDASKTDAALALTKGNENSTIKYVKSASQPADDAAYTGTYTSDSTTITVADDDVIWLLVTAEDTTTKLYYKIMVTVTPPSSDATLKAASTVKGETLLGLGTPNAVIGSATGGTVTVTLTKAADTTNLTTFITLFDPTDAGAAVNRVVKYATGVDPTTTFETDTAYDDEAITTLDFFIIKVTAEDTTTILYYKVVVTATRGIGDPYLGGILAYILVALDPGYDANVQHGLIAATGDQSTGIAWSNITAVEIGAAAQGIALGTGPTNTAAIIGQAGHTGGAAKVCENYLVTVASVTYSDWFLPSKDELYKLYLNKVAIGGFANDGRYWSSSEGDADLAWYQVFSAGSQGRNYKYRAYRVRAVRDF